MDDTLWLHLYGRWSKNGPGLNPCFSGWYSLIMDRIQAEVNAMPVLILVLVDDTLWLLIIKTIVMKEQES